MTSIFTNTFRTQGARFLFSFFIWLGSTCLFACTTYSQQTAPSRQTITTVTEYKLLNCLTKQIFPKIRSTTPSFDSGKLRHSIFCALSGLVSTVPNDYALAVALEYDPMPIGGVLVVTAQLLPAFPGFSGAARAVMRESETLSVDRVDLETIEPCIRDLTIKLGRQYDRVKAVSTSKK